MTKTRSFSIFLLKDSFNATNALKAGNDLKSGISCSNLPEGAVLHVLDNQPYDPWWKGYFGVQQDLKQASKGALIFLPVKNRWFALSFGHVAHNLKDASYEYDFGLRVTLNCVDPDRLKSTDTLEPAGAKRQRTQLPTVADLTFFDLDTDAAILKSLTGKVKDAHKGLFKHVTGSSSIHISSKAAPHELIGLCESLLDLYKADTYKTAFPGIQNISPVRDPTIIDKLNDKLVAAFRVKDDAVALSVPEIEDHAAGLFGTFYGAGAGERYEDIFIGNYYDYLSQAKVDLNSIGIDELKKHRLEQTDEDGHQKRNPFSIFKCLIFDTTLNGGTKAYHLCDGNWYEIETSYVKQLSDYLDPLCKDTALPIFSHKGEGEYNEKAVVGNASRVCLDTTNIAPKGQKQVEPCDVFELAGGQAVFHHVKISTLSPALSHLFNQGTNAIRLIRESDEARSNLETLVSKKAGLAKAASFLAPLKDNKLKVVFGIITHKDKAPKSANLPLFSRISLMRCMRDLRIMGIEAEFSFIKDSSPKKPSKPKAKVPKGGAAKGGVAK